MMRVSSIMSRAPTDTLSSEEYSRLSKILTKKTGILFSKQKRRDVQVKISAELQGLSPEERQRFIDEVDSSDESLQNIVNKLTIGESYFFRNHPHFAVLRSEIIPEIIKRKATTRSLRIWCAACSKGEEPYSLAILLRREFPELANWNVTVNATDINTAFLERAKQGVYTKWAFRGVDEEIVEKYFTREAPNRFRLSREIASMVDFSRFNLSDIPYTDHFDRGEFDLIVCRNVLIYFRFDFANRVIKALSDIVDPGAYLIVGHAESFPALSELDVVYSKATFYYRKPSGDAPQKSQEPVRHTLSIPGIGVHQFDRRTSSTPSVIPPPPPSAKLGSVKKIDEPAGDRVIDDLLRAQDHADMGEILQARAILNQLLEGTGSLDYRVHFLSAVVSDQENETSDALTSLKQAIFLNKDLAIAHYYQGVICEREDDKTKAIRAFKSVIRLARRLPAEIPVNEGGGITAKQLMEIAEERTKELEIQQQTM